MTEPRLLVVDDEEVLARQLVRTLSRRGYSAISVGCVTDAKAALEANPTIELVLCDMNLPDGVGIDLLAWMRTGHPDTGVIMVSAVDEPTIVDRALELGAYGYISKPFERNEILIGVASGLRRRTLEIEHRARHAALQATVEQATVELEFVRRRAELLVQHSSDTLVLLDEDLRLRYVSPAGEGYGWDPTRDQGFAALDQVHPDDHQHVYDKLARDERTGGQPFRFELRLMGRDGEWRWNEIVGERLLDDPAIGGWVLGVRDIDDRKRREDELYRQARVDELTGLANRRALIEHLQQCGVEIGAEDTAPGSRDGLAVVFVDLDRLKVVNDSLGHDVGDAILREFAARLPGAVGPRDLVARFGGDEFVAVVRSPMIAADAERVSERLLEVVAEPFVVSGRELRLSASVGVAYLDHEHMDVDALLRDADAAMYEAKVDRPGHIRIFEDGMRARALLRLEIEHELQVAVRSGQITVHYQPQVDVADRRIVGIEALVRWAHPTRGLIPPGEFLGLAEEANLMGPIGDLVLEQACIDAKLLADYDMQIAVNVAPSQLFGTQLASRVASLLDGYGVDPRLLSIEVTESGLMREPDRIAATLDELREVGVGIALDDFGTGWSSLAQLLGLPIDELKVDRAFTQALQGERGRRLMAGIANLGHALGCRILVEGVETEAEWECVRAAGADRVQGWLTGRAMPIDQLRARLAAEAARRATARHAGG